MHAKSLQSCLTLCDPMACSPLGSSVRQILQARILDWIDFSGGSDVKQIANGNLLCDAVSSTQCSVKTQRGGMGWEMGGRFKKEGMYVYLWLIHSDVCKTQHNIGKQLSSNKKKNFFKPQPLPSLNISLLVNFQT